MVAEETEPIIERELAAAGIALHGKDILPRTDELLPGVVTAAVRGLLGEPMPESNDSPPPQVFPRPPGRCASAVRTCRPIIACRG